MAILDVDMHDSDSDSVLGESLSPETLRGKVYGP
jgi:hypothetical protein